MQNIEKIIHILKNTIYENMGEGIEDKEAGFISDNTKFSELGISSYLFIKYVVEIEECFDIEFDDNMLTTENFEDVQALAEYVESKNKL